MKKVRHVYWKSEHNKEWGRTRIAFALILCVLIAAHLFGALRPREPVFEGKRLSAWLEDSTAVQIRIYVTP